MDIFSFQEKKNDVTKFSFKWSCYEAVIKMIVSDSKKKRKKKGEKGEKKRKGKEEGRKKKKKEEKEKRRKGKKEKRTKKKEKGREEKKRNVSLQAVQSSTRRNACKLFWAVDRPL